MVWIQITSVMIAVFVVIGGVSLLLQAHSIRRRQSDLGDDETEFSGGQVPSPDTATMDDPA